MDSTNRMQDFHEDDEDGPAMSRCALGCAFGAVVCLAVLVLVLAAGLLLG